MIEVTLQRKQTTKKIRLSKSPRRWRIDRLIERGVSVQIEPVMIDLHVFHPNGAAISLETVTLKVAKSFVTEWFRTNDCHGVVLTRKGAKLPPVLDLLGKACDGVVVEARKLEQVRGVAEDSKTLQP